MQMPMIVNNVPVEKKEMSEFEIMGIRAYLNKLNKELFNDGAEDPDYVYDSEESFGMVYVDRSLECLNMVTVEDVLPPQLHTNSTYNYCIDRFILSTNDVLYAVAAHEDDEDDILLVRIN